MEFKLYFLKIFKTNLLYQPSKVDCTLFSAGTLKKGVLSTISNVVDVDLTLLVSWNVKSIF